MDVDANSPGLRAALGLLNVLIQTASALVLGFVCVHYGFIRPDRGDVQAVQFFVGRIALPILVFNIVATADVGSVDPGVILACTLGKIAVYLLTFVMTLFAYRSKEPFGQRLLTSAVFGFFTTASNDLALGFPVIDSIYGDQMSVYVAANVLVFQTVIQPLAMMSFEIGHELRGSTDQVEDAFGERWRVVMQRIARSTLLNPIIIATGLGCMYSSWLGWTLRRNESGHWELPQPFGGIIQLWTSPFTMMFLFLNGTSLQSSEVGLWPAMLVLMKVVVCAYISYGFSHVFVDDSSPISQTLKDFTFFYGTIPAGGAPLIYAQFFNCGVDVLTSASILGLILAGPIEFMTSLFLGSVNGPLNYGDVRMVLHGAARASAVCAAIFVFLVAVGWWGGSFSSRAIGVFGIVTLLYELWTLMLMSTPGCGAGQTQVVRVIFRFLQNSSYILVVYICYHLGTRWREGKRARSRVVTLAVLATAAVPTVLLPYGNTYHEMCGISLKPHQAHMLIGWNAFLFLMLFAAAVKGRMLKQKAGGLVPARQRTAAGFWLFQPLLSAKYLASKDSPGDCDDNNSTANQESMGLGGDGVGVAKTLIVLQGTRSLMGVINGAAEAIAKHPSINMFGFAPMLILEDVLEHGQGCVLLLAVLFQPGVLSQTRGLLLGLGACGCCGWGAPLLGVQPQAPFAQPKSESSMFLDDEELLSVGPFSLPGSLPGPRTPHSMPGGMSCISNLSGISIPERGASGFSRAASAG